MNILVTGGAGFIGSHTVVELQQAGYEVIIADNLSNANISVLDRIAAITGRRPAFYEIDVADKKALSTIFAENRIDAVIHFAGLKAVGESCRIPLKYYRNNLDSTLTLLEVMEAFGCSKFVFSSSATVYGPKDPVPYTEDMDAHVCTNPYGWTKSMIEQLLRDYCAATPGFTAVLLRYFHPIGGHEPGLLG
ncbi:MAG: SDR family NAD(P)-dependent oxidoreductase, partial [Clostridia bacterium]|nr:SDR family NAD(P)-dependent oxidoreductase [Clostridia bacterium]